MERRDFMRLSVVGVGAGVVAPTIALAEKSKLNAAIETSDIYYTKESPGRWSEKIAGHLSNIAIEKKDGKVIVRVVTAHEMKGYEHYIVKHVLLDKNHKFLDEYRFDPSRDKAAVSSFTLDNYTGDLYVLSLCNKHDLWLNSATV